MPSIEEILQTDKRDCLSHLILLLIVVMILTIQELPAMSEKQAWPLILYST